MAAPSPPSRIPYSRGCPVGYRRAVLRPLTIAFLGTLLSGTPWGCSDLLPSPDLLEIDVVEVDTAEVDVPDIGQIECQGDEDCQEFAQCCLDVACLQGRCMPRYVPDCCTAEGPCAVDVPHHTGTCEATCVAGGCGHQLSLRDEGCGEVLWELGDGEVSRVDDQPDRITWHRSRLRPFDGRETLRAGDILCPTYHGGALGEDCQPLGEGGAVRTAFDTPTLTLPATAPALVELIVYADLGRPDELTELGGGLGVDRLELIALPDGLAATVLWTSSPAPGTGEPLPQRAWTPVLVDLSRFAGRSLRLRFAFDTGDGRDNHHEGVAIGRLRVFTPCEADRLATGDGVCRVATATRVHPLSDELPVSSPPLGPLDLHAWPCQPCAGPSGCVSSDACEVPSCEAGRCTFDELSTSSCCTPDPRFGGDGSFETVDEWELDGLWDARTLEASAGLRSLHFGLDDGSGLAEDGERAAGMALGPAITVHQRDPVWRFALKLSTEWDAAPSPENARGIDLLEALAVLDDDPRSPPEPFVVWDSRAVLGTTLGEWVVIEVPLDRFAGRSVRLGWRFDTVDAEVNSPGGVFIDEAAVVRACPPCDPERETCRPPVGP